MRRCRIPGDNIVSFPPNVISPPLLASLTGCYHGVLAG